VVGAGPGVEPGVSVSCHHTFPPTLTSTLRPLTTPSPQPSSPRSAGKLAPREALKRHLLIMIVAIIVLDSIAIPMFYLFHFDRDVGTRQQTFIGIWVLVSAAVVAVQLRKIRRARVAAIRESAGSRGGGTGPGDQPGNRSGPSAPGS
jgi:hypothetical protein